jgi:hypothetical protein
MILDPEELLPYGHILGARSGCKDRRWICKSYLQPLIMNFNASAYKFSQAAIRELTKIRNGKDMLFDRLIVTVTDPTNHQQFMDLPCGQRLKDFFHVCPGQWKSGEEKLGERESRVDYSIGLA